jgi:hypothetical protein
MTMLLEEAIKRLQDLPEEEQDFAADIIFVYLASEERGIPTDAVTPR